MIINNEIELTDKNGKNLSLGRRLNAFGMEMRLLGL